jgi:hypothetical protein
VYFAIREFNLRAPSRILESIYSLVKTRLFLVVNENRVNTWPIFFPLILSDSSVYNGTTRWFNLGI